MRKTSSGCGLLACICLTSMFGSALLMYALLTPGSSGRWIWFLCAALCLAMTVAGLYILSLARRAMPARIFSPDAVAPFPAAESLTYDDILARLRRYLDAYFSAFSLPAPRLPGPVAPPQLEKLFWPCWFIEAVKRYDDAQFSALLAADKPVIDFLCDRLFAVGMDDADRRLQSYRASSPAQDAEAHAWFRSQVPQLKDTLTQYVREHIEDFQRPVTKGGNHETDRP